MSQLQDEQTIADVHYTEITPPLNQAWKDIIRPVTIFQILQAEFSPIFEDKSLVIDGRGFGAVTLVAHVIRVESHPGWISYYLEDGTGRICAVKDLASVRHLKGSCPGAEEEERAQSKALEHTYVEVIGTPQKSLKWAPNINIKSIQHVHDYHQVVYHILDVIHCNILIPKKIPPYGSDVNPKPNKSLEEDLDSNMLVDDIQTIPTPKPILPNAFSPQRQHPYAALAPLEGAIVTQMYHHRNHCASIRELAQIIQASCGCTEFQFGLALQALLAEAYLTSPLDDGYVVLTPRH